MTLIAFRKASSALVVCVMRIFAADASTAQALSSATMAASAPPLRSSTYLAKIASAIRSNIVFDKRIEGNPVTEVLIFAHPSGGIKQFRLQVSSRSAAWRELPDAGAPGDSGSAVA